MFKVAKERHRTTLETMLNKYIKDKHGILLASNDTINDRWKEYYDQLLNEEFPSEDQVELPPVTGPLECIHPTEVKLTLNEMDNNKAQVLITYRLTL